VFYTGLFNSNNFVGSAALAEICALLSDILVLRSTVQKRNAWYHFLVSVTNFSRHYLLFPLICRNLRIFRRSNVAYNHWQVTVRSDAAAVLTGFIGWTSTCGISRLQSYSNLVRNLLDFVNFRLSWWSVIHQTSAAVAADVFFPVFYLV